MIKITGIEIENFGRHRSLKQDVGGYVVGLTGPNGLGKSTVLQALQFAITGAIDHPDPLCEFIRNSPDKQPKNATVAVSFLADGREGKITRKITRTSTSRRLELEGAGSALTSDADVSATMLALLGVDKKAINSTVFIRQGEMDSMFGTDTERRDFYARLLMVGHMDKIADVVEGYRKQLAGSLHDLGSVRDTLSASYEEALAYFQECEDALAASTDRRPHIEKLRELLAAMAGHDTADERYRASIQKLVAQYGTTDPSAALAALEVEKSAAEDRLKTSQAKKDRYMQASSAVKHAEDILRDVTYLVQAHKEVAEIDAELAALGDLGEDPAVEISLLESHIRDADKLSAARAEVARLKAAIEQADNAKRQLEEVEAELTKSLTEIAETLMKAKGKQAMRETILAEVREAMVGRRCEVCGAEDADIHYIEKNVSEGRDALVVLEGEHADAVARWEQATAATREINARRDSLAGELQSPNATVRALQPILVLFDPDVARDRVAKLVGEQKRYQQKEFAVKAAQNRRRAAVDRTHGKPDPGESGLIAAEHTLRGIIDVYEIESKYDNDIHNMWSADDVAMEVSARAEVQASWTKWSAASSVANDIQRHQEERDEMDRVRRTKAAEVEACLPGLLSSSGPVLSREDVSEHLRVMEVAQREFDELTGKKIAADGRLRDESRKLDEIDLRMAEQKHRRRIVSELERVREAFRPNGASLEYLNYRFGQVASVAADYLAEGDSDFMVAASPTRPLSFDFLRTDKADEAWMAQSRLSGGQRVRLAVACLRAIHALVTPDVGLLVLDEPTTHLDAEATESLAEMLKRIGQEGVLQLIVCDHSPALVDAFSDTIRLK